MSDKKNQQQNTNYLGFSQDALAQRKAELLQVLAQTSPDLVSDNQLNVEALKTLLGEENLAPAEHYELSWAGKNEARREIQKTTSNTLKPSPNNPNQAQHMLVEGENLEVLRVLQKSYYGKVKMIYIDPPYNTGNDSFVYPDNYSETLDEYLKRTGEKNEQGYLNKQSLWKKNSKESGQYHSAWLSMMYPRLYLARNLLRDDGVIFISIDDNEAANLKLLCDEVFGADSFVGQFIWVTKNAARGVPPKTMLMTNHEYVLTYSKNINNVRFKGLDRDEEDFGNPDNDPRGLWRSESLKATGSQDNYFTIVDPDTGNKYHANWAFSEKAIESMIGDGLVLFPDKIYGTPRQKKFIDSYLNAKKAFVTNLGWHSTENSTKDLMSLFGGKKVFDFPKPKQLLSFLINQATDNEIVLDFFAGSGSIAQSVMELNVEDGGNRQSISVQMPELLDGKSEAYKVGYRTVADITRARIDKVIAKLKEEHPDKTQDLSCAHFTLGPSNFKVWQGNLDSVESVRDQLEFFQQVEKQPSSETDIQNAMFAELLLKKGLGALGVHAVSKPKKLTCGITIHRVLMDDDRLLWLCFEPYQEALKAEITAAKPAQVILLNSCFTDDATDEQLSNLKLELEHLDIGLLVI